MPKPVIYGTAFPIAPGIFATAGHVVTDAMSDGVLGLTVVTGPGDSVEHYACPDVEVVVEIDFGMIRCPGLSHIKPIPIDFDRPLGLLASVSAVGFPMAVDAEFVALVPRGFGGYVNCRRELYHLAGQPTGYEVSFFAPQGLSGAPLVSAHYGRPACYGYVIQQSTIGIGDEHTPVGLAVGINSLLSVRSNYAGGPLAKMFRRDFVAAKRSPKRLPGGWRPTNNNDLDEGWPGDEPTPTR